MTDKAEIVMLEGQAYWAKVHTPNDRNKYSVDISLNDEDAKRLEKRGISVKNRVTGKGVQKIDKTNKQGNFVTATLNNIRKDGTKNKPPTVLDASAQPLPSTTLIGNGSKVKVKALVHDYTDPNPGTKLVLLGIQVLELIPYTSNQDFTPVDGYTATDSNDETSPF